MRTQTGPDRITIGHKLDRNITRQEHHEDTNRTGQNQDKNLTRHTEVSSMMFSESGRKQSPVSDRSSGSSNQRQSSRRLKQLTLASPNAMNGQIEF
ncbi:hypothetical protein RRG08_028611 [Elysia crispata]|uniref:Uncharacterized protein n=1 Tax=Elysia crispata TaxID=231223 RepID=A0AAE0ZT46_9GAST|nr:hypothetical protein RRG08_028611 [Elysia crispata]